MMRRWCVLCILFGWPSLVLPSIYFDWKLNEIDERVEIGVESGEREQCIVVDNPFLNERGVVLVNGFGHNKIRKDFDADPNADGEGEWDRTLNIDARICSNPIAYEALLLSEFYGLEVDVTDSGTMTQLIGPIDDRNSAAVPAVYLACTEGINGKMIKYVKVVVGDSMNCTLFREVMPTVYCSGSTEILGPQAPKSEWLIHKHTDASETMFSTDKGLKQVIVDNNQYQVFHRYGYLFVQRLDGGSGSIVVGTTIDGFFIGTINCVDTHCSCIKKKRSAAEEFLDRVSRQPECDGAYCSAIPSTHAPATSLCETKYGVGLKRRRRDAKEEAKPNASLLDRQKRETADQFGRARRAACELFSDPYLHPLESFETPETDTMLGLCVKETYADFIMKNRGPGKSLKEVIESFQVPNDGDETGDAPAVDLDDDEEEDNGKDDEKPSDKEPDPEFLETADDYGRCPVTYDDAESNFKRECKVVKKTDTHCGIFSNANGPLKECIASSGSGEFNAAAAYQECRLAVCARMPKKALCNVIKQHVDLCLGEHIMKGNDVPTNAVWRSDTKCTQEKKPKKNDSAGSVQCVNPRERKTCWNPDGCNPLVDITDEAEHHACDEYSVCSGDMLWDGKKCRRAGDC